MTITSSSITAWFLKRLSEHGACIALIIWTLHCMSWFSQKLEKPVTSKAFSNPSNPIPGYCPARGFLFGVRLLDYSWTGTENREDKFRTLNMSSGTIVNGIRVSVAVLSVHRLVSWAGFQEAAFLENDDDILWKTRSFRCIVRELTIMPAEKMRPTHRSESKLVRSACRKLL